MTKKQTFPLRDLYIISRPGSSDLIGIGSRGMAVPIDGPRDGSMVVAEGWRLDGAYPPAVCGLNEQWFSHQREIVITNQKKVQANLKKEMLEKVCGMLRAIGEEQLAKMVWAVVMPPATATDLVRIVKSIRAQHGLSKPNKRRRK